MRHEGWAPFLAVRQSDGDSLFVAVHHPYAGVPLVQRVDVVPLADAAAGTAAVRVELRDAVDTIVIPADPDMPVTTADGRLTVHGRFAHIRETQSGGGWAYLVDGQELRTPEHALSGASGHRGLIHATERVEAGAGRNAFLTDADLPPGDRLHGQTVLVDEAGVLVQSFRVDRVSRAAKGTAIEIDGEPGMTITPDLVKLEYYPCWGLRGAAQFRIPGFALLRTGADGAGQFSTTGTTRAWVGDREVEAH